ncbi:MAG: hypothetical protein NZM40_10595 [Sphingomonadaceae bacterium]|uniref:hypothetical protein n=1 Tax=Thermaurantiacus sp. TaxID=2820283 RepID=UPI00298F28C7|nr:hypothetical protein [Thermaurantiacus sp.]MCS6987852.1 hypothetical protein [Sphingomonadaceae bacterium]MDW8414928.1 hypothetical protein [Thermaurantiacus sp.]
MSRWWTWAALAVAAPVAAETPAPRQGLLGLDAETTRILVEAGQKARAPGWDLMLRGLREERLAALEQDPVDWARLVRAIESEKALEALRINRALDAELEAFARMTPAQRRQVAAASRRMSQTLLEMQAAPRN